MTTRIRIGPLLYIMLLLLTCCTLSAQSEKGRVRNIVLVHGAWADGSGWKGVYDILIKDGYKVNIVQEPETSFKEDVAATKRVLALQDGPCILVAHSYGGAVITEARTDPSVAGLVYVAAHMPDAGENEADDGKRFPSDLSKSTAIKKTADGFTYLDPAQFHKYFAADLSAEQAAFMARSQVFNAADNFKAVITTAAWRSKPSWMLVATKLGRRSASKLFGVATVSDCYRSERFVASGTAANRHTRGRSGNSQRPMISPLLGASDDLFDGHRA